MLMCIDSFLSMTMQALNDHINVEFTASYAYHALFAYFDRDTVALNGFAKYFKQQADEVRFLYWSIGPVSDRGTTVPSSRNDDSSSNINSYFRRNATTRRSS